VERCFHCHEPLPTGADYSLGTNAERRRFCCPGCRAVAELIDAQGLTRFYELRSAPALKVTERDGNDSPWAVCDRPEVERRLIRATGHGRSELRFRLDGINCAACAWLIDRGLTAVDGVEEVSVNPVSHEALVRFDPSRVRISRILESAERFGFEPRVGIGGASAADTDSTRAELKRLAVAGLGFGQVMMLSAALYLGAFKAMDASFTSFFVLASMLVATPVVLYAGAPIFRAALADLSRGRAGMDVPVALAIVIALGASLANTFRGAGAVYYDSATMFVFFLTLGRFLEARARYKATGVVAALADLKPLRAHRLRDGAVESIGTVELDPGDVVVVEPGESVPADGELLSAAGTFDEALLSGESQGRRRERGDAVLGGSLNLGQAPVEIRITRPSNDGFIDRVGSLLHRAMADRPDFLELADRWAAAFVVLVLLGTAATGVVWLAIDRSRALEVVLAMLVVTCPCALSLAAPTAFAVALGRLARIGLLCRSARVFERLGEVTTWLFDKTGTISEGRIGIVRVATFRGRTEPECLRVAAALESGIEHPVARALRGVVDAPRASDIRFDVGFGVTGSVEGRRYRLGSARYVEHDPEADDEQCVYLADDDGVIARIVLADRLRAHARAAVRALSGDAAVELVSGDSPAAVAAAARVLGIQRYAALQTPQAKLEGLSARQAGGDVVAAVGDGINDAPLLAQADVSIAMVAGSQLAQASADIVFTGDDLRVLARLPQLAQTVRKVVRQNLLWAALYNVVALPLAAAGVLAPWMAALGMSLSSLVVVGNALRLNRLLAGSSPEPAPEFAPFVEGQAAP
jgi:Cu2+-exporting ATPase